jgi:hypothetical protein
MIQKLKKCWSCNEYDEHGCHIGRLIGSPCAIAINIQLSGLCEACQIELMDEVERTIQRYIEDSLDAQAAAESLKRDDFIGLDDEEWLLFETKRHESKKKQPKKGFNQC